MAICKRLCTLLVDERVCTVDSKLVFKTLMVFEVVNVTVHNFYQKPNGQDNLQKVVYI